MDPLHLIANPGWAGDLAKTIRECTCDEMLLAIPLAGLVGISPESSWLKPVAQRVVFHYEGCVCCFNDHLGCVCLVLLSSVIRGNDVTNYAPSLSHVYGLPPTSRVTELFLRQVRSAIQADPPHP
jgi:hypothetical protein